MRASRASRPSWRAALLLAPLPLLALIAACSGTTDEPAAPSAVVPPAEAARPVDTAAPAVSAAPDLGFPTGPAVLVEVGYEAPRDHVASTGAYVPANGKPTLVFVDAIW